MSINKTKHSNEIDLTEIFITIWNDKLKIFLFITFAIFMMFLFIITQPEKKISYLAQTDIKPISTFDEFEYESYNDYLKNTNNEDIFYSLKPFKENSENARNKKTLVFKDVDIYTKIDNSSFNKIDKIYLLNLFVDKLNGNSIFIKAIKKFNIIKREDYQTNKAYENAILKLAASIKLTNKVNDEGILTGSTIEFSTDNKEAWGNVLKYIQDATNNEIQKYLNDTFNRSIINKKKLRNYKIEDIDILITNAKNKGKEEYINYLEILRNDIKHNRNIARLEVEFASTPIAKSKKFQAGRLMVQSTSYKNLNNDKFRMIPMLILAGLFGAFFGIFYALISNSIKRRV